MLITSRKERYMRSGRRLVGEAAGYLCEGDVDAVSGGRGVLVT